jgi:PTS system nitrogen regulatory IIA component
MEIRELLEPDRVVVGLPAREKAGLLTELANRAAKAAKLDPEVIRAALEAREQLGSTGVGHGVAIPHARIKGLKRLLGYFARLERSIDFAAIDDEPVDLVFLLLIPAEAGNEYLAALSAVSRRLRDREAVRKIRAASDASELHRLLAGNP